MSDDLRQIALYGKGGIGKSTVASNLSVALTEMGRKVMQVGCSPKADSVIFLLGGEMPELDILGHTRDVGVDEKTVLECILTGHKGIICVEAGGPDPAEGCAGRGVALALDLLKQYKIVERCGVDFVLYDAIADVVCGGFGQPMRAGYAREVYLVTSGELMSIYSSNNICSAIADMASEGRHVGVGGIINNMRGVEREMGLIREFAERLQVPVIAHIPRSELVGEAETQGGTVMELFPDSEQADHYRNLGRAILDQQHMKIPAPMELEDLLEMCRRHQVFE